ncbi:MAG: hypothetical protein U0L60_06505, partial [Ruminococcus sp.]|nr:hypothetical protein [Ruminococcus sp.]
MKTKIKRHSRSVLSVVLTLCMLVSCITVGLITTDAAQAGAAVGASHGYDQWFVKGSFDMTGSTWNEHEITNVAYSQNLSVGVYNFSFLAKKENSTEKDEFSANETFSSTRSYNLQK